MKLQNSNFLRVKYYYSIYFMHNNSLRRQIAWQSRQQSRNFRKNNRFISEDNPVPGDHSSNTIIRVSNDCNQHSELKWLQKVVFDMKRYKIDPKQEQHLKQGINHSISYGIKKNILEDRTNVLNEKNKNNQSVSQQKVQKKRETVEEDNKRSGKKIKFQIISNKENKVTSARKSTSKIPETSHRSAKKVSQSSSKSNLKATKKVSDYKSCEPPKVHCGVHQVTISPCLTEELSNIQIKEDVKYLWDDRQQRNESFIGLNRSYDDRKSAGKIIKNQNQRLESVKSQSLSSTFIQKGKNVETYSSKKHQKVFLKLETENLSKYLGQSQIKEEKDTQKQEPLQQSKLYPTKKQTYTRARPFQYINIRCEELNEKPEKGNKNAQMRTQENQQFKNSEKTITESNQKNKEGFKPRIFEQRDDNYGSYVRTKSQQRKLNQSSLNKNTPSLATPILEITSDHISYDSKKASHSPEVKFKNYKDLSQKEIQIKNITIDKSQKLFTLYSEGEDSKTQKESTEVPTNQLLEPLSKTIDPPRYNLKKTQIQEVIYASTDEFQPQKVLKPKQVPSFSIEEGQQSPNNERELTLLFNFLDQSKRRLLTSSNCRVEGLTEQLKLMFSSIINQIKTKKRAYTLQKFISESKSVMEVKREVYSSNQSLTKANIINQILKENIEILKKKSPLELIKQTHTKSIFETNQNSKRSSLTDNRSIVIAKIMLKEEQTTDQPSQLKKKSFKNWSDSIDMEQPQNYFKQKYGIVDFEAGALSTGRQAFFSSKKQADLQEVGTF